MIQLPYKSKKKLLIGLTITELVLLAIVIGTAIATFDYNMDVAINEYAAPWIGDHSAEIMAYYNMPLMNALSRIGNAALILWIIANGVRFAFIKPKYKIFAICGVIALAIAIFSIGHTVLEIICLILAVGLLGYSHKIDKEEVESDDKISHKSKQRRQQHN